MAKHKIDTQLVIAALGSTVALRVSKANELTVGQLRILCGVVALRSSALRVSAALVSRSCGWSDQAGRMLVREVMRKGLLVRIVMGTGWRARTTLELTSEGYDVVQQYKRAERDAVKRFLCAV